MIWILALPVVALGADRQVPSVAYPTINDAVAAAGNGDRIVLAAGTYCEDVDVSSVNDLEIVGAGIGQTVIDGACGLGTGVLSFQANTGSVALTDLTVDGKEAIGGLILNDNVYATVTDVAFINGYVEDWPGGAVRLNRSGATLDCTSCVFCANQGVDGGAVGYEEGGTHAIIRDSVFVRNSASDDGGAVDANGSTTTLINNTFVANSANDEGEAIRLNGGNTVLVNNIFVDHSGTYTVDASGGSVNSSFNNLFWNNSLDTDSGSLNGSVLADPMLTDVGTDCSNYDLSLQVGSAAIGAGHSSGTHDDIGAMPFVEDADGDGYTADEDCDDGNSAINPDADEVCGGGDEDCDGLQGDDDPSVVDPATWYADDDGDGYGDANVTDTACDMPTGYVADNSDCDDTEALRHPGEPEVCDGLDNDCDDLADDDDPSVSGQPTWFLDGDGDGVAGSATATSCTEPNDAVVATGDCDDANRDVFPGADEVCNGIDDDCDDDIDDDDPDVSDPSTWYTDADGDGFGSGTVLACDQPKGTASAGGDCDDGRPEAFPGAPEQCNNLDDDCDTVVDNGIQFVDWFPDADMDGYGDDQAKGLNDCQPPKPGWRSNADDCDDDDDEVYLDADELCDGVIDHDCDGDVDEGCPTDTAGTDTGLTDTATGTDTASTDTALPTGLHTLDTTDTAWPTTPATADTTDTASPTQPLPTGADTGPTTDTGPTAGPTNGGATDLGSGEGAAAGCRCAGAPATGAGWWWVALALWGARRRR